MPRAKGQSAKKIAHKRKKTLTSKSASGGNDTASRRKWKKGGRIEAYTMGEALGGKNWP